jgi:hypothetical protein
MVLCRGPGGALLLFRSAQGRPWTKTDWRDRRRGPLVAIVVM